MSAPAVMTKPRVAGVYAITPEHWPTQALLESVEAVLQAGVRWLQFRDKKADSQTASALASLCQRVGAVFVMNDNPLMLERLQHDGSLQSGIDPKRWACHLGKDDMALPAARALLGPHCILGASCYGDLLRAQQAVAEGADYIAFGAMFPSRTKPHAAHAPLSVLAQARPLQVPVVAIGGITLDNLPQVIAHGADAAAVVSSLFGDTPNPDRARLTAQQMVECFDSHVKLSRNFSS